MIDLSDNAFDEETETTPEDGPRPYSILVVDDEEQVRTVWRLVLTRAGYNVREAEDGETALARLREEVPDLILLDVLMPGMDGIEVCRQVRADSRTAAIPILIVSGKTDPRSRQEGLDAGATLYLTKPQPPEQLLRRVAEVLGQA
jgi:CheY-like chemotaxis protein